MVVIFPAITHTLAPRSLAKKQVRITYISLIFRTAFMNLDQQIQRAIKKGELKEAFELFMRYAQEQGLDELYNNIILLSGRYHRNENHYNRGTHDNRDYSLETNRISSALSYYLEKYFEGVERSIEEAPAGSTESSSPKSVFLSYSTKDSEVANRIKAKLEENGINVIRDDSSLPPGVNIKTWILDSIEQADYTLSVISQYSLISSWVAFETNLTLQAENFTETRYLPVLIDDIFSNRRIVDELIDKLEMELKEINEIIQNRLTVNRGIEDLESERERLKGAIDTMPKKFRRLREHLSVDIRDNLFETGMQKIINKINAPSSIES